MNEKLETVLAAWRVEEALHAKHALRSADLWKLVKALCKHEDGHTQKVNYFSGSYYDRAYETITLTCKVCGHSDTQDTGWRGGYG